MHKSAFTKDNNTGQQYNGKTTIQCVPTVPMGIMGKKFLPPLWFSCLCPCLSLTGSALSPSAQAGSRAAGSHLSESGYLALCRSAKPNGPETSHTNTQTTPTKIPLSLLSPPSIHNAYACMHAIILTNP